MPLPITTTPITSSSTAMTVALFCTSQRRSDVERAGHPLRRDEVGDHRDRHGAAAISTKTTMTTAISPTVRPAGADDHAGSGGHEQVLRVHRGEQEAEHEARAGRHLSIAAIHFGSAASSPGFGRLRHWRCGEEQQRDAEHDLDDARRRASRHPDRCAGMTEASSVNTHHGDDDAEHPAEQEPDARALRLRREQHEDRGDDRDRADRDAERERQDVADDTAPTRTPDSALALDLPGSSPYRPYGSLRQPDRRSADLNVVRTDRVPRGLGAWVGPDAADR